MRPFYFCLLLTTGSVLAAADLPRSAPVGGLTASGDVWINDALLPSGSRVRVGDEIRTGPRALAVIEGKAIGRVEVRENSTMRLESRRIVLQTGAVAAAKTPVLVADARITPQPSGANWFVVREDPNQTVVAVHSGSAIIERGRDPAVAVRAGMYAQSNHADATKGEPVAKVDDDDEDGPAAIPPGAAGRGAAQAAKQDAWNIGSLASAKGAAILTGVAAVAITGIVAGGTRDPAVSPD